MSSGSVFFAFFVSGFARIFGQIVSIRVNVPSNTNLTASRHIKKEKALLTVDVRRSKTPLLKGGLQLNFGGIGVKLRMKERRIEEGIHVNQLSIG